MTIPWEHYHRRWGTLGPPLRPHADVCASIRTHLDDHDSRVLLLGVTPELADVGQSTLAVDCSIGALAEVWPGDTARRHAVHGQWQHLPCAAGVFSAAVGDGSLNCLTFPHDYARVFDELLRHVRPGGRIVLRVYVTPSHGETLDAVRAAVLAGHVHSLDALKWRIAMALCTAERRQNLEVSALPRAFHELFPSRRALMLATGWTEAILAQIDVYEGRPEVYSFPTELQLIATLPVERFRASWHPSGNYELAERCPLLVLDVIDRPAVG